MSRQGKGSRRKRNALNNARPQNKKAAKIRRRVKKRAIFDEYLSNGCSKCGSCEDLTFHHLRDKLFTIARGKNTDRVSVGKFQAEIDKCVVLCLDCHKVEHPEMNRKVA